MLCTLFPSGRGSSEVRSGHGQVRGKMIQSAQYRQQDGMALFGLVWLLRVRGAQCDCASCSRDGMLEDSSSREEDDAQEGPSASGEHQNPARETRDQYRDTLRPKGTIKDLNEVKEIPTLSRDTQSSSREASSISRDIHNVTREMLNMSVEVPSGSCDMYGGAPRELIGMQNLHGEVVYRSDGRERTSAQVCVSSVESEIGDAAGGYPASGLYETVVTQDATVQTDFEDDDYEYETYTAGTSELGGIGSTKISRASSMVQAEEGEDASENEFLNPTEMEWQYFTVELERGSAGLGFSIAGGTDGTGPRPCADQAIYITKLTEDGAATLDGRLTLNDAILEVNGVSVVGVPHATAVDALKRAGNHVTLCIRRANPDRRGVSVQLEKGPRGLGFSIAGGRGSPHVPGDVGIFVTQVSRDGAAAGRLAVGDKIVAVRNAKIGDRNLVGATHAEAVAALKAAGDTVELLIIPASREAIQEEFPGRQRSQATSCSALHELATPDDEIPRGVRTVTLRRSGSRLGMDIVGGEGGGWGVFVSGVAGDGAARGRLHRGDQILAVDGADLTAASHEQAARALKGTGPLVTITAQYKPEEYRCLEAKIRELNMQILRDRLASGGELTKSEENLFYRR